MAKLFYLSEIVKFAIEKEKEASILYKELGDKASAKNVKDLFYQLMLEEREHEDFYTKLLGTTPKEQSPGVTEDSEYETYMQELIRASRSTPALDTHQLADMKIALDYAIAREKESILFYVGLKNYLPAHDNKKIDTVVKEESQHMAKLLLLKRQS
jgi:rubrerythrin